MKKGHSVRVGVTEMMQSLKKSWVCFGFALCATIALWGLFAGLLYAAALEEPGFRPGRQELERPPEARPVKKLELKLPEGGQAFGEELKKIKLLVQDIKIIGATHYSPDELRGLYAHLIGQEVTLADVYLVEEEITRKYRDDGFILSRAVIPEQRIKDGVVEIRVVEGFIDTIIVEGGEHSEKRIRKYTHKILESKPLHIRDLERYLLFVNDLPGITSQSILRPSDKNQGASNLVAMVEHKTLDGNLSYDNYGSHYVGPIRGTMSVNLNSFMGFGERITLDAMLANPASELKYSQLSFALPLGNEGITLTVRSSQSPSEPDDDLAVQQVESDSTQQSLEVHLPVVRSRDFNFTFDASYTHKANDVDVLRTANIRDRLKILKLTSTVEYADALAGYTKFSVSARKGYDWNSTKQGDLLSSRPEAHPQFICFSGEVQRNQGLHNIINGLNLFVLGQWQYANKPLFSSEEFGLGGRQIGRGYDTGEILGEKGYGVSVELQYTAPEVWGVTSQLYGFYDTGEVWNRDRADDNTSNEKPNLSSDGLGARFFWNNALSVNLEVAKPVGRIPVSQVDKEPRYHLGLSYSF